MVRPRTVRKRARLFLVLDHSIPSLYHKRGSYRFHYLCTPDYLAYVGDAESGSGKRFSPLARTRGSITNSTGPAWMEDQGRPATHPRSRRRDKCTRKYAGKPQTVSDGYHHALDDSCARKTSPPKTRSSTSSLGWPQTGPPPPCTRVCQPQFTSCSATISSTHDTCSDLEIITGPTMTTLPSRHPFSPATKHARPLPGHSGEP